MEGTEGSTVRLDRVGAGRDVNVSTTTVQVFVGTIWGEDRTVSVAPDGSVCVEQPNTGTAVAPAAPATNAARSDANGSIPILPNISYFI